VPILTSSEPAPLLFPPPAISPSPATTIEDQKEENQILPQRYLALSELAADLREERKM
jgi:hypothetical protein